MGGYRYGSGRPSRRLKHESAKRIEIRYLKKNGYLEGGGKRLSWQRNGEKTGSILVVPNETELLFKYSLKSGELSTDCSQTVGLRKETCRFGGYRCWLICPRCKSKRTTLYFRNRHFACRVCQDISYQVQSGGYEDRICHNFHKLEETICDRSKWGSRSFKDLMAKMEIVGAEYNKMIESAMSRLMATSGVVAT